MRRHGKLRDLAKAQGITIAQLIANALTETNGNEIAAARLLKVYPNTIRGWLERHPGQVIIEKQVTINIRVADLSRCEPCLS